MLQSYLNNVGSGVKNIFKQKSKLVSEEKITYSELRGIFIKQNKRGWRVRTTKVYQNKLRNNHVTKKTKITNFSKLFFFLTLKPLLSIQAYKLFLLMELQLNATLLRSHIVPFFFMVRDLCFYRIIFVNQLCQSNVHTILSLNDVIQLPLFLYQIMNYRQNRLYFYPGFLNFFFKTYWGQFIDHNIDKVWILSNYLVSKVTGEVFIYSFPNLLLYLSPFRRFSKLYYKFQPERLRNYESGISYTYTIFKIQLFNYANFYK